MQLCLLITSEAIVSDIIDVVTYSCKVQLEFPLVSHAGCYAYKNPCDDMKASLFLM